MKRTSHSLCVRLFVCLSHYLMMKCLRSTIIIIHTNSYNCHNRLDVDIAGHSVWTVHIYVYIAPLNDFLRLDWAHSNTTYTHTLESTIAVGVVVVGRAICLCENSFVAQFNVYCILYVFFFLCSYWFITHSIQSHLAIHTCKSFWFLILSFVQIFNGD